LTAGTLKKTVIAYLWLMVPICCFAAWYSPYGIDGDSVAYMDIADLLRTHRWAGIVNGYWHPLYPAVLAAGQLLFHPALMNERRVYVMLNWVVFLAQAGAVWLFVGALVRLRERMSPGERPLLSLDAMRLLGVGVLMASALREMDMGKIRPDGLLQALLLMGFATMLQVLATEKLWFAPLMGLFFGLAYLTKSFAFVVALLSILVMIAFQRWMEQRPWRRVLLSGALAGVVFAAVAGPYMAALSLQKHRLDFGDSGSLNFAWYSAGTQKMHLELGQTERFGSASVRLVHPVPRLLDSPPIYSYKALRDVSGLVRSYVLQRTHCAACEPTLFAASRYEERCAGGAVSDEPSRGMGAAGGSSAVWSADGIHRLATAGILVADGAAWIGDVGDLWVGQYRRAICDGGLPGCDSAGVRGADH
jgi:hypothetical protein